MSSVIELFRNTVILMLFSITFGIARAQNVSGDHIYVTLLDGRSGHPVGSCVNLWLSPQQKRAFSVPVDKGGAAEVIVNSPSGNRLGTDWPSCGLFGVRNPETGLSDYLDVQAGFALCQKNAPDHSWLKISRYSIKDILSKGISTENTCGKATATAEPGHLVIFVRPLTFWEKLKE